MLIKLVLFVPGSRLKSYRKWSVHHWPPSLNDPMPLRIPQWTPICHKNSLTNFNTNKTFYQHLSALSIIDLPHFNGKHQNSIPLFWICCWFQWICLVVLCNSVYTFVYRWDWFPCTRIRCMYNSKIHWYSSRDHFLFSFR